MTMSRKYILTILLAGVWAVHFILMGALSKEISPFATGTLVRFGTFLILTFALLCTGRMPGLINLHGAGIKLFCIGALGFLLDATSFVGFRFSNASTGTVLLKTDVVIASLITVFVFKQRFRKLDWLFTGSILIGVCLVMGINPIDLHFQVYDIFFILSALFVTINAFLIKHVQETYHTANYIIAYYNNLYTFILFTIVTLVSGRQIDIQFAMTQPRLLSLAGLGSVMQTLIYLLYYKSLSLLPVHIIKIILLLIPVFTMVFSIFLFGQYPTVTHLVGSVIVLASAFGIVYTQKNNQVTVCDCIERTR